MCFVDINTGWLIDELSGKIVKTSDGGTTWTTQYTGTGFNPRGLSFIDTDNGWVAGNDGIILHTADGGLTWEDQFDSLDNLHDVYFVDINEGWAVGDKKIIHTSDGGDEWNTQLLCSPYGDSVFYDVYFFDKMHGWVLGYNVCVPNPCFFILRTVDGGQQWEEIGLPALYLDEIVFIDSLNGWVVGRNGKIFYTTDGGNNWIEQISNTGNRLTGVVFVNQDKGWAVGDNGTILQTDNGGIVFTKEYKSPGDLLSIYPNPATNTISLASQPGIEITSWDIMDSQGKAIMHQNVKNDNLSFDISHLSRGLYFIRLHTSEGVEVKKLLVH
jgi:photosystem II stability/assembly factor-like uncharacterized protein